MYTVNCLTGRLVEVRFLSMDTADEARAYVADLGALLASLGGQVVSCGDVRRSKTGVYRPEVAEVMTVGVAALNPHFERVALIASPERATFNLQTGRMVRETGHPNRRSFVDPEEAKAWLGEVLTPDERARLDSFLAEGD